jgi:hypothetical protein
MCEQWILGEESKKSRGNGQKIESSWIDRNKFQHRLRSSKMGSTREYRKRVFRNDQRWDSNGAFYRKGRRDVGLLSERYRAPFDSSGIAKSDVHGAKG